MFFKIMKQCTQIGSKIYINNNLGWVAKKPTFPTPNMAKK